MMMMDGCLGWFPITGKYLKVHWLSDGVGGNL